MAIFTHLVPVGIQQARASENGSDDARIFGRLESLLAELRTTRAANERAHLVRRIRACEDELALHLERSGRSMLAGAMVQRPIDGEPDDEL